MHCNHQWLFFCVCRVQDLIRTFLWFPYWFPYLQFLLLPVQLHQPLPDEIGNTWTPFLKKLPVLLPTYSTKLNSLAQYTRAFSRDVSIKPHHPSYLVCAMPATPDSLLPSAPGSLVPHLCAACSLASFSPDGSNVSSHGNFPESSRPNMGFLIVSGCLFHCHGIYHTPVMSFAFCFVVVVIVV